MTRGFEVLVFGEMWDEENVIFKEKYANKLEEKRYCWQQLNNYSKYLVVKVAWERLNIYNVPAKKYLFCQKNEWH